MNKNNPSAIRGELRRAIRPLHDRLDRHPVMAGMANPEEHGREAYLQSLKYLLPFWQASANRDSQFEPFAQALRSDTSASRPAAPIDHLSPMVSHYVLWGSTLGVRSLAHRIPRSWPRQFIDLCITGQLGPPKFSLFKAGHIQDVVDLFNIMLVEADRHVAVY